MHAGLQGTVGILLAVAVSLLILPFGASASDEYFMNVSFDGTVNGTVGIANHTGSAYEGNWIFLKGGAQASLPSPLIFTYSGVNSSTFNVGDTEVSVTSPQYSYTRYSFEYPYSTHRVYTTGDDVSFTFYGSSYFEGETADVYLLNDTPGHYRDILLDASEGNLQSFKDLVDGSDQREETIDGNGDFSVDYGNLDAGSYGVLIFTTDGDDNGVFLSGTTFEVVDYEPDVTFVESDDSDSMNVTVEHGGVPAQDYTYCCFLIREDAYRAEIEMNFTGTSSDTKVALNDEHFLEGLNAVGFNLGALSKAEGQAELSRIFGTENFSSNIETNNSASHTLTLDTTSLADGDCILFTIVCRDGYIPVAFMESSTGEEKDTGGGGGGNGGGTTTPTITSGDDKTLVTSERFEFPASPGQQIQVNPSDPDNPISSITFTSNTARSSITVDIDVLKESPVDVGTPGEVYIYLDIQIEGGVDNASVSFQVDKDWLDDNNLSPEDIVLMHYNATTGDWEKVSTAMSGDDAGNVYYTAYTGSFSPFAIVALEALAPGEEVRAAFSTEQVQDTFTVDFRDMSENAVEWYWDFGDGDSSALQNPSHTYASAGTYVVTLTVTGSDDTTDTHSLEVNVQDQGARGEPSPSSWQILGYLAIIAVIVLVAWVIIRRRSGEKEQ